MEIASKVVEVEQYVTESDWIPEFWNFLLGLDCNDLIAELIQNDLDQDATETVISFHRDRLISEGNGHPVDADGWRRLRKIRGAWGTYLLSILSKGWLWKAPVPWWRFLAD